MRRREFLTLPALAAAQNKLAADFQRPQYHFLPPANWMNDPNGPIWWKGRYHLFYQYNPNGAFWGTMHWGHASSEDLVHWKHLPVALAPTPGGPDKDGVFTGSAAIHDGVPALIYTGVHPEVQCLATSDDQMLVWKKYPANPVIAAPPPGMQAAGFRDPCVWREDDGWYVAIGSGYKGVGGTALLYRSDDLVHWSYLRPLFSGTLNPEASKKGPVAAGEMWECPDFFPLGGKHVLYVSTEGTAKYWVGRYEKQQFHPESTGILDFGGYYAPKSLADAGGRRIVWGWIQEQRSVDAQKAAGWSGVMSLPRVLTLRRDGSLGMEPAPELAKLRGQSRRYTKLPAQAPGDNLEIACRLNPGSAHEAGLNLGGLEVRYDRVFRRLSVLAENRAREGHLALPPGEPLDLRIFLDGSVVEIFVSVR